MRAQYLQGLYSTYSETDDLFSNPPPTYQRSPGFRTRSISYVCFVLVLVVFIFLELVSPLSGILWQKVTLFIFF